MPSRQIRLRDHDGDDAIHTIDTDPDACPKCHYGIKARPTGVDVFLDLSSPIVERVFQCPRRSCGHVFIGRYNQLGGSSDFVLFDSVPYELSDRAWTPEISEISPDFCRIANEAQKAERLGLKLVAGPGFRKALEFLIKDYAIKFNAGAAVGIKKMPLIDCIKTYMSNPMVKEMAERATWLGNDETHYTRKWEGKDMTDLKALLGLVMNAMQTELQYHKIKKDMPEGKK